MKSAIRVRSLLLAWALCSLMTLPIAWNARYSVYGADIAYLELASNGWHWGPQHLLWNGYWSPAYPTILAAVLGLAHPARTSALSWIHGVDWVVCVLTYLSFTYFLFNFLKWIELRHPAAFESPRAVATVVVLAYAILFTGNLDPSLWHVRPDILLEGAVYLAAGVYLRTSLPNSKLLHYAAFGAVLAVAYMTKAVLFPLSLVLLVMLSIKPACAHGRKGIAVAAIAFLLCSSPFAAIQSYARGRLTFGDAGNLNYAQLVNGVPASILWQSSLSGSRILRHPPEIVSSDPVVVKFDGPFQVSLPDLYDRSYWYDGVRAHFNLREQLRVVMGSLGLDRKAQHDGVNVLQLAVLWIPLFGGVVAFAVMGVRLRSIREALAGHLWLIIWPAASALTYACVVLQYRYLVSFIVLGWIALFAAAWIAFGKQRATGIALTVAATLLLGSSRAWIGPLGRMVLSTLPSHQTLSATATATKIAARLEALGIRPNDEIAYIRARSLNYAVWLAGARLTHMVVGDPVVLSKLSGEDADQIIAILRGSGARALISTGRPGFENDSGWISVGANTYIRMIP